MDLGAPELLIILVLVLLLFGGAKLPSLARSLGQAKREFQSGLSEDEKKKSEPTPEKGELDA
jgi:sec-independent protein translocase protein TatA